MTQRKPGDYVINAELTDEQRERFVADCVTAGAEDDGDGKKYPITQWYDSEIVNSVGAERNKATELGGNNVTHEYKEKAMTAQSELMRQIADAMEKNPEGWWKEFQLWSCDTGKAGAWINCYARTAIWVNVLNGNFDAVRPKPCTYTLHIEDMPEPLREEPKAGGEYWVAILGLHNKLQRQVWNGVPVEREWLESGLCYPDEQTAREALEKLTRAMGGGE